jgi:hypothetical protein
MATRKHWAEAQAAKAVASKRCTKQQRMIDLLRRPDGATLLQLSKTFGWEPHTVRGAISGALKKKLGLSVLSPRRTEDGSTESKPSTSRALEASRRTRG